VPLLTQTLLQLLLLLLNLVLLELPLVMLLCNQCQLGHALPRRHLLGHLTAMKACLPPAVPHVHL
jgi:hypothetical protein